MAFPFRGAPVAPTFALVWCACASAPELSVREPESAVTARAPSVALAAEVLALADLEALHLALPDRAAPLDPRADEFWHVAAWAFASEVRAGRSAARAALAREDSAGAPGPVELMATDHDFASGGDPLVEAAATFDLFGWLGLGPSAAERAGARVEALLALAELQAIVWRATFEVDRARVRLAAARARAARLERLHDEAALDAPRLEILARHGRLSPAAAQMALGHLHHLLQLAGRERQAEQVLATELALACGLFPEHAALAAPDAELLDAHLERALRADDSALAGDLSLHPRVVVARLGLALGEARARVAARAAWPGLRLGPHLAFAEGEVAVGGLAGLSLPVPARWRGELAAARARRDRALEAYEEAWLAQRAALVAARERLRAGRARLEEHARVFERSIDRTWGAVRARFRVGEAGPDEWSRALLERADAALAVVDETEGVALAALDGAEARGPRADGAR